MTIESPKIDKRRFDLLVKEMEDLIPHFLPGWKPGEGGAGLALIKIFAHMTEEVIHRLNRVPRKHFGAFLDMLGITPLPAAPAKAPLTFCLSEGAGHVMIPGGTPAAARAGDEDIVFATGKNMWATPAKLVRVYAVDGKTDEIFQWPPIPGPGKGIELFKGDNLQSHILYLGHEDLFNVEGPVKYELNGLIGPFETLTWEYWSENQWHSFDKITKHDGTLVLEKTGPGEIGEQEINGIKSRWIRCTAESPGMLQTLAAAPGGITAAKPLAEGETGLFPGMVFCNDIPVDPGTPGNPNSFYPFTTRPGQLHTFYIGHKEAFSKKSGLVKILFDMDQNIPQQNRNQTLRLSWEYGTRSGWKVIEGLKAENEKNGYYRFWQSGGVSLKCPADIEPVIVGGQENYWVRVRIIDGDYGKGPVYDPVNQKWLPGTIEPPIINKITIHYRTEPTKPQHCITFNNLEYKELEEVPFYPLGDRERSLYLGFDKKMEKGPISMYVSLEDPDQGGTKPARVEWYYYSVDNQWKVLDVEDHTRNLGESGTLEFFVPLDFVKKARFGEELYWFKAVGIMAGREQMPEISGIHLNTTAAVQVERIKSETLGSGDGGVSQEFCLRRTPVISEEIWIDETGTLTKEEKQAVLEKNGEGSIREVIDETGKSKGIYVRWEPAADFFGSSAKSRHYVIQRASGQVRFGDGIHGMIPPAGRDNITVSYLVGGGKKGNVGAFEISRLKTSIPHAASIFNPEPARGGADTEKLDAVFKRGPCFIKHRDRAVTQEDFERIASEVSAAIARSKCVLKNNRLIIIVIPQETGDKPIPSRTLIKMVKNRILERRLNTLSPGKIMVQGPRYVEVGIEVDIFPVSMDIAVSLERELLRKLKEFLHPLYGGPEKKGWDFGRDLHVSDVYALLESIEGVDHAANLKLNGKEEDVVVDELETLCSGQHKIVLLEDSFTINN
jgi:hypothetical protein